MKPASVHQEPIDYYIKEELTAGHIIGPLAAEFRDRIHISCFGVIPKPHQPGKWSLITDRSSPGGSSVDDGMDSQLCSLFYTSVDDAVRRIRHLGRGTALAKFDIASAYRMVLVHPVDRLLLGMAWKGELYVDWGLPLGLRSAPKLFTAMANGDNGVAQHHGSIALSQRLLDAGAHDSQECKVALQTSLELC